MLNEFRKIEGKEKIDYFHEVIAELLEDTEYLIDIYDDIKHDEELNLNLLSLKRNLLLLGYTVVNEPRKGQLRAIVRC